MTRATLKKNQTFGRTLRAVLLSAGIPPEQANGVLLRIFYPR